MISFPITIDHEELPGSPVEVASRDGLAARRVLRCAWADRLRLAEQILTAHRVVVAGRSHTLGHAYPHRDGLYAAAVEVRPWTDQPAPHRRDARVAGYESAQLEVTYCPARLGEVAEETLTSAAEFVSLSSTTLYWDAAGTDALSEAEAPGRILGLQEWTYTIREVVAIPAAWADHVGRVNQGGVASAALGVTFAPETLLYLGAEPRRSSRPDGTLTWEATLRFSHKKDGWNKFFKRGESEPRVIYGAGGAQHRPYPLADFAQLELA